MNVVSPTPIDTIILNQNVDLATGNFPWMIPINRFLATNSKRGEKFRHLYEVSLGLVKARKESGMKVTIKLLYKLQYQAVTVGIFGPCKQAFWFHIPVMQTNFLVSHSCICVLWGCMYL